MLDWLSMHLITLQTILVNNTTPCFLNYTASNLWQNCGMNKDFLQASLIGWQYITGGYFSMILVGIFILFSYIKYHKAVYPLLIGVLFLPISYFVFPGTFINYAIMFAALSLGITIWYIMVSQTNES